MVIFAPHWSLRAGIRYAGNNDLNRNTIRTIIAGITKFSLRPVLTIVVIGIRSVPNTIAFGGVAVGNMKAQDAVSVAVNNSIVTS